MYDGQIVFCQLMELVPRHPLGTCARRYHGERRVRHFSCRDQFLCMALAQLTYRQSLRDIEACLRAMGSKLYHAGFRSWVSRSTQNRIMENPTMPAIVEFPTVVNEAFEEFGDLFANEPERVMTRLGLT